MESENWLQTLAETICVHFTLMPFQHVSTSSYG